MTIDKIKHYIGSDLVNHFCGLTLEQLTKAKADLLQDINTIKLPTDILFKRTIELELINNLLR